MVLLVPCCGLATQHSREDDQGATVTRKRNDQREVVFIDEIPNPYSSHTNSGFFECVPTPQTPAIAPSEPPCQSIRRDASALSADDCAPHRQDGVHSQSRRDPDDMSRKRQRRDPVAPMGSRTGRNSRDRHPGDSRSQNYTNGCQPFHGADTDGEQNRQRLACRARDRGAQQQIDRAMQPQSGQNESPRYAAAGHSACARENPEFSTGKGKKDPYQYEKKAEGGQGTEVPLVVTLEQ